MPQSLRTDDLVSDVRYHVDFSSLLSARRQVRWRGDIDSFRWLVACMTTMSVLIPFVMMTLYPFRD